jgi:hypothetical protein
MKLIIKTKPSNVGVSANSETTEVDIPAGKVALLVAIVRALPQLIGLALDYFLKPDLQKATSN